MVDDNPVIPIFRRAAEDRDHGAGEIERVLLSQLLDARASWTRERLAEGSALLLRGQPAMASLIACAERAANGEPEQLEPYVRRRLSDLEAVPEILADRAWRWIDGASRVVTVSRSSAVAAVVKGAWIRGWPGEAAVLEGTSAGRGDEQARDLAAHGRAFWRPDADAVSLLGGGVVAVVGADAVSPSRFLNCTGTRALLEAAADREIPRLVVADRGKDVDDGTISAVIGAPPMHRDTDGGEWPLFEAVPLELITARISD